MTPVFSPKGLSQSVAIAIAWAVSTAFALVFTHVALEIAAASFDAWVVFGGSPLLLGGMQWLVLRWFLPKAWLWVVATMFGSILGWFFALGGLAVMEFLGDFTFTFFQDEVPEIVVCGIVAGIGGAGIGVSQWLYLRRYLRRAGWWVLGSAIALGIGAGPNLCEGLKIYGDRNWLAMLAMGGLAGGAIKGGTLMWLLSQRKISQSPESPPQGQ